MWSTHDLACAHCRARKIRCGRERPQCESCKRDGVECRYSSPGKRINHVKLLCQNFEALEDHLSSIQSDLSALTSLVKSGNGASSLPASGDERTLQDSARLEGTPTTRKDRHIVRNTSQSVDRYHGPCSLYILCREFQDNSIFETADGDEDVAIRILLQQMVAEAGQEHEFESPYAHTGICLPPRQFLNIVVGQFFKNADYATDIFLRSTFQAQLDLIYSQSLRPSDEGWAICFNVIVLLTIGKDHSSHGNSPFIQPFRQTLNMAINNSRIFLTPRLVNVQALALLSYVVEQHSNTTLAETVFAQACHLARTMGLDQCYARHQGFSPEETLERQKVLRSLYIRDKNFVICRGSSPCLSEYESSVDRLPKSSEGDESKYLARIELARVQDEIYEKFQTTTAPDLHPSRHSQVVSHLEHKLEQWDSKHRVTKILPTSSESAVLMLSFFSTRLYMLRDIDDPRCYHQSFKDAKACCLLFLLATTAQPDSSLTEALDQLLGYTRSCSPMNASSSEDARDNSPQNAPATPDEGEILASVLPRLAASFPLAAVFTVARRFLYQPMAEPDDAPGQPEEEILILEAVRDRFAAAADQEHAENFALRLSRIVDFVTRIVRQKLFPETLSTPPMAFNELSSLQSTASSNSQRTSVGASLKGTPPGPEAHSTATSVSEAVSNSSMLLPFMQPLDSSNSCSPWLGNASHLASGAMVLAPWPAPYKQQQHQHHDGTVHVGKRQRLSGQGELFDITPGYADHGHRPEEDSLFTFDFLSAASEVPSFEVDE
ncbi:hypothetical protein FALBO_15546 [Fusarium albosuccineum]|uniref:Zn(2)-C6 fungal-type domain-containing protein n=1 Tax=Fusarium albosuccineum TaxID=1237068 RepID=A0A8H4KUC6_9HYPO|nr:hypothetical protein FALBO_15546 [Fusarium albosuccineum]